MMWQKIDFDGGGSTRGQAITTVQSQRKDCISYSIPFYSFIILKRTILIPSTRSMGIPRAG